MLTYKSDDLSFVTRTQQERAVIPESCPLTSHMHALECRPSQPQDNKLSKNTFKITQKIWLSILFYHFHPSTFSMLIYSYLYIKYFLSFFSIFSLNSYISIPFFNLKFTQGFRREQTERAVLWPPEVPWDVCDCSVRLCSLSNTNALK